MFEQLGLDPAVETPGREVVRHIGESLVEAMEMAQQRARPRRPSSSRPSAWSLAETKDHLNWELIGELRPRRPTGDDRQGPARAPYEEVEDQEDEHLYHTTGWTRELWIESLGMPAVLPPPEEQKHVKTAIGAARAKGARDEMKKAG